MAEIFGDKYRPQPEHSDDAECIDTQPIEAVPEEHRLRQLWLAEES